MPGLLQVALFYPDGRCVEDMENMEKALFGSDYVLDQHETSLNDGIAMVTTPTESEAERLMELGEITLSSGYRMEIDSY